MAGDIARRTVEESAKDAGALPLLSYLLDDMWTQMVERGDGKLRLPAAAIELGRVLVERADTFLAHHPESEEALRRLLTLRLADVREEPVRDIHDPVRRGHHTQVHDALRFEFGAVLEEPPQLVGAPHGSGHLRSREIEHLHGAHCRTGHKQREAPRGLSRAKPVQMFAGSE